MVFNVLTASFLNIVFVQKNITELTLEFNIPSVKTQTKTACLSDCLSFGKKDSVITPGRKQRTPKQMTTIKQDFACLKF